MGVITIPGGLGFRHSNYKMHHLHLGPTTESSATGVKNLRRLVGSRMYPVSQFLIAGGYARGWYS